MNINEDIKIIKTLFNIHYKDKLWYICLHEFYKIIVSEYEKLFIKLIVILINNWNNKMHKVKLTCIYLYKLIS